MIEEMGSGNKLQRQKKGPSELGRKKGKGHVPGGRGGRQGKVQA